MDWKHGNEPDPNFLNGCVRTYGAATRLMRDVWEGVVGEPMPTLSGSPRERFREAVYIFAQRLKAGDDHRLRARLAEGASRDAPLLDLISESLLADPRGMVPSDVADTSHDIDDVSPNIFKEALYAEAMRRTKGQGQPIDVDLDNYLHGVVTLVIAKQNWSRRLNVGNNRHFPRMFQWLREVESETTFVSGAGVHTMNRVGRGRVASYPSGPDGLKVRINPAYLRGGNAVD